MSIHVQVYYFTLLRMATSYGQSKQVLNGYYLEKLGYGYTIDELDLVTIEHFLNNLPRYQENISRYLQKEGNTKLFTLLDEHLDRIAADLD